MNTYATEHSDALAQLTEDGAAVAFEKETPGTHDASTGRIGAPTTTTVSGFAIQVSRLSERDARAYDGLSLTPAEAPMLLFAASTFGQVPALGSKCLWNNTEYFVRGFGEAVAPTGVAICTRPIIGR